MKKEKVVENNAIEEDDSSQVSDSCFADIGFMFDGEQPTETKCLHFFPTSAVIESAIISTKITVKDIQNCASIVIDCVDDDPGAVQSGHYLWPGAPALAQFLVDLFTSIHKQDTISPSTTLSYEQTIVEKKMKDLAKLIKIQLCNKFSIVELGAGCGLAGLTAMQLPIFERKMQVSSLIFTDHDPGTLNRAEANYNNTMKALRNKSLFDTELDDIVPIENSVNKETQTYLECNVFPIPIYFEKLVWGDVESAAKLLATQKNRECMDQNESKYEDNEQNSANPTFTLVLGSDLIYCEEVVRPLIETIAALITPSESKRQSTTPTNESSCQFSSLMIMSQSFQYEHETELSIDNACSDLNLVRSIISCNLENGGTRIQIFHLKNNSMI